MLYKRTLTVFALYLDAALWLFFGTPAFNFEKKNDFFAKKTALLIVAFPVSMLTIATLDLQACRSQFKNGQAKCCPELTRGVKS